MIQKLIVVLPGVENACGFAALVDLIFSSNTLGILSGFLKVFAVRLQSKENLIQMLIFSQSLLQVVQLQKLKIFASFQNADRYFERA